MKILIFDTLLKDIPDKQHPASSKQECLVITPYNNSFLKAGDNRFVIHKIYPSDRAFNKNKLEELCICQEIDTAKDIALLISKKERENFINY